MKKWILCIASIMILLGCGQKGALYPPIAEELNQPVEN